VGFVGPYFTVYRELAGQAQKPVGLMSEYSSKRSSTPCVKADAT
jgi:hypothetical protein